MNSQINNYENANPYEDKCDEERCVKPCTCNNEEKNECDYRD